MSTKICTICKKSLLLTEFHTRKRSKSGYASACKNCVNARQRETYENRREIHCADMRRHYRENKNKYQKNHAIYRRSEKGIAVLKAGIKKFLSTEHGKTSTKNSLLKYKTNNRHKLQAHWAVKSALKYGKIKRDPCAVCGDIVSEAHHTDYSKKLDVMWLCTKHHKMLHRTVCL